MEKHLNQLQALSLKVEALEHITAEMLLVLRDLHEVLSENVVAPLRDLNERDGCKYYCRDRSRHHPKCAYYYQN